MKICILLGTFLSLIILVPVIVSAGSIVHPALLFDSIQDTPGYQYNTTNPWKSYQNEILRSAGNEMGYNFSGSLGNYDRIMYRGSFARDLGFAYQITKNAKYAEKAEEL